MKIRAPLKLQIKIKKCRPNMPKLTYESDCHDIMLGSYIWQQRMRGASLLDENMQWTWPHGGLEHTTNAQFSTFHARMRGIPQTSTHIAVTCLQAAIRRKLTTTDTDWVVL